MYEKKCNGCGKYSYSSSRLGNWLCPYCQMDLTKIRENRASNKKVLWIKDRELEVKN